MVAGLARRPEALDLQPSACRAFDSFLVRAFVFPPPPLAREPPRDQRSESMGLQRIILEPALP